MGPVVGAAAWEFKYRGGRRVDRGAWQLELSRGGRAHPSARSQEGAERIFCDAVLTLRRRQFQSGCKVNGWPPRPSPRVSGQQDVLAVLNSHAHLFHNVPAPAVCHAVCQPPNLVIVSLYWSQRSHLATCSSRRVVVTLLSSGVSP